MKGNNEKQCMHGVPYLVSRKQAILCAEIDHLGIGFGKSEDILRNPKQDENGKRQQIQQAFLWYHSNFII